MSIEVKVGQRWRYEGVECRVAAICGKMIFFDDGRWDCVEHLDHFACELLPSRENEYVQGESVEIYNPHARSWSAAVYCLPINPDTHVVRDSSGYYIRTSSAIRRPKLAMKWVVPTQADIDAATGPIPCLVRDYDSYEWDKYSLLGIIKFGLFRFAADKFCWKYCLIQVPANDPREAVEVKS